MENILVSNERQNLRSEKCNSDSFSRFGDDLSEWLLTFLPLKQKFRFESISKQWKSLLFNKVFVLDTNEYRNDIELYERKDLESNCSFIEKVFETVVKKCLFIKVINIQILGDFKDNGSIFEIMANNCQHLQQFKYCSFFGDIKCNDIYFYDKFNEFIDKCGIKLRSLEIKCDAITDQSMKRLLMRTPNVAKVLFNDISIFLNSFKENFLQNLNEVKIYDNDLYEKEFKVFVNNYNKQIKRITFITFETIGKNKIKQLSSFEKLEFLKIFIKLENTEILTLDYINECLKMIARKCKQLKEFSFVLDIGGEPEPQSPKEEHFEIFSKLISLKTLTISIYDENDYKLGQMKHLSNIKTLSKLDLNSVSLSDEDFKDIHIYCPQLKAIRLSFMENITDKTLDYLSKIANLSKLELESTSVTLDGIQKTIDKYLNLKFLKMISFIIPIDDKVIEDLQQLAKKYPKVLFKFYLMTDYKESEEEKMKEILLKLKTLSFPKNLLIKDDMNRNDF